MEASSHSVFTIELLASDIIYVERGGQQAEQSLGSGFARVGELAEQLRQQGKPVLILNHAHGVGVSERVLVFLQHMDFDRIAVYGTSKKTNSQRDLMVRANGLEEKIASFQTEDEALAWLRSLTQPTA